MESIMDIFKLDINEFEKEVKNFLNSISEENLMKELKENGLCVDNYDVEYYYDVKNYNNVWIHKEKTSNKKDMSKSENILEAA